MNVQDTLDKLSDVWNRMISWLITSSAAVDLQTAIICAVVFIISAIVVYLISVFGMRERTYEEAIEEQRRRNLEAVQLAKQDKTRKDKKFKKRCKKNKDKIEDEKGSLIDGSEKIQDGCENEREGDNGTSSISDSGIQVEPKVSNSRRKAKHGTLSTDSAPHPSSSEETDEQLSHSDSFNKPNGESTEESIGLKDNSGDSENNSKSDFVSRENVKGAKLLPLVDEVATIENLDLDLKECSTLSKSPSRKRKKSKSDQSALENQELNISKIVQFLQSAVLTEEDLTLIFDMISSRQACQSDIGSWSKENDSVPALRKQILEKEEALDNEQKLLYSANEKIKFFVQELKQEKFRSMVAERSAHDEKSRAANSERSWKEKLNQHNREVTTLRDRLKLSHEQHVTEMQTKLQELKTKMNEKHAITVQRLKDEIQRLKDETSQLQALHQLESEKQKRSSLETSRLQLEVEQLRSARDKYETHQAAMQQAQDELRVQVQQLEKHIEQLVSSHQDEEFSYTQKINEMNNKLQQAETTHSSLIQELQTAQSVCESLEADKISVQQLYDEIKRRLDNSEQDNLNFKAQLEDVCKSHVEFSTCIEQSRNEITELKKSEVDHLRQVQDLEQENKSLKSQLTEISEHMDVIFEDGQQTNSVENQKDSRRRKAVTLLKDVEVLEDKCYPKRLHSKVIEDQLNNKLKQLQKDLINEKDLKQAILSQLDLLRQLEKKTLYTIFPDIDMDEQLDDNSWHQQFQEKALAKLHNLREETVSYMKNEINDAHNENLKLRRKLDHYKKALTDTEKFLNQLQNTAEEAEKKWKEKLSSATQELMRVTEENSQLSVQKEVLERNFKQFEDITEMQGELVALQSRLQSEEYDKQALSTKFNEAKNTIKDLQAKLTACEAENTYFKAKKDDFQVMGAPLPINENDFTATYDDNSNTVQQKSEKRKKSRKRGTSGKK